MSEFVSKGYETGLRNHLFSNRYRCDLSRGFGKESKSLDDWVARCEPLHNRLERLEQLANDLKFEWPLEPEAQLSPDDATALRGAVEGVQEFLKSVEEPSEIHKVLAGRITELNAAASKVSTELDNRDRAFTSFVGKFEAIDDASLKELE
ncbi:unnamed protein product, partial [marine sediment metagenome]